MRFSTRNSTSVMPSVLAAVCTATVASTALADRWPDTPNNTVATVGNSAGNDGSGIVQDFETFNLGAGCNQQGWTGFCDQTFGFQIVDASAQFPTFGGRTARHNSDNSAIAGFEIVSPINSPMQTGVVGADIVVNATTGLYQFVPVNTIAAFFNTRVHFLPGGQIQALQIQGNPPCQSGFFAATSGTWTAGTKMRIAVESPGDGTLKIYKDGVVIFTGHDIAAFCDQANQPEGINQVRVFADNVGPTTDHFLMDNISDSITGPGSNPCQIPLPSCRADVGSSGGGPPDTVVNVADLLIVIQTWGQTQNPPGTGPRPKGDCDPLPNGNCLVNVGDLLAVIQSWGNCPAEIRACCFSNGSCQNLSQANCTAQGGVWNAPGSTCNSVQCPILPNNDECGGAVVVNNGANAIDNTSATNSQGVPGGDCILGGAPNFSKDLWFKYTATCNGWLDADLCTGTVTDTVLAVYSGTCGALTQVGCDDDACTGDTANGDRSKVRVLVTQGTQYFIRAGSWGGNAGGPMTLTIACSTITNDECVGATSLTVGAPATCQAITGATGDSGEVNQFGECTLPALIGRWYKVVGNGSILTADTCDSPLAFWDRAINVYCGDCGSLFCVNSENDNDTCGKGGFFNDAVSWCSEPGKTYYILVHVVALPDQGDEQNYCVKVTSGASCNQFPSCALPGDECNTAVTVVAGNNPGLSNVQATSSVVPATSCLSQQEFSRDVWFKFTAPATAPWTFSMCASTQANFDGAMAIYSGACGNLTEVACNDDGCGPASRSVATANLTSGTLYYVRIGSWSGTPEPGAGGGFDLNITQGAAMGACCVNGACTQQTAANCAAQCGSVWTVSAACGSVTCVTNNAPGTTLCGATTRAGNGSHNTGEAANGTRPAAGWGSGLIGVMEDLAICGTATTVNNLTVEFLDQLGAGTGTLSTYNQIVVKIYPLNGQAITNVNWGAPPAPVFDQTFTVGSGATKTLTGVVSFGLDVERWTITMPGVNLPVGTYGVYFSFPQLTGTGNSCYIATGGSSPNNTSPQAAHIVNLEAGGSGASTQHSAVCVRP